jgi:tetratricopeptide (TPR) repeat protein
MTRISLCMIVRDEVANLERCLRSVDGVVDEVCVLDTGSADGTPELAARLGARVERGRWTEDFSAARNASIALADGDWVLVLDADEELDRSECSAEELRAKLVAFARGGNDRVGRLRLRNLLDGGDSSDSELVRFFARDPSGRFEGRIHEQWTLHGCLPPRADTGVGILHHGYRREALERGGKFARNVALLARELEEHPEDGYAWYQLGRTLAAAEQHEEALRALEAAVERCADGAEWGIHAVELGATALRALGHSAQGLSLIESALPMATNRTDTRFLAALLALDCGDVAKAEAGFRACLARGPSQSGAERSAAAGSWAAAHNLGVICEHTGRPEEAARHYRAALAARPDHRASADGLARLRPPLPPGPAIR